MRIKLVSTTELDRLKASIPENLPLYRAAAPIPLGEVIETKVEVSDVALKIGKEFDLANIISLYESFRDLPASLIRDERMWVYLTHSEFAGYAMSRYSIPEDDAEAVKAVQTRLFASTERQIESRNAVSRLCWIGFVASRFPGRLEDALEVITLQQDILLNMIERPGVLQVPTVFNALMTRLVESYSDDGGLLERITFRSIQKALNLACGSTFVECLPLDKVQRLVDKAIESVVSKPHAMGMA